MNKKTNAAPLSTQVEEKLLQYIKDNDFKIGTKIPNEATLSKTFSVGRSSLREATSRLVSRGVLEVRQGSGTFILDPIPSDEDPFGLRFEKNDKKIAQDLLAILIEIEPMLAALAAKNATTEDIKAISKAASNKQSSIEFHSLIAQASKNCLSENLIKLLYSTTDIFKNTFFTSNNDSYNKIKENIAASIKLHDEISTKLSMLELLHSMYLSSI